MHVSGAIAWWSYRYGVDCPCWLSMLRIIHSYFVVVRRRWHLQGMTSVLQSETLRNQTGNYAKPRFLFWKKGEINCKKRQNSRRSEFYGSMVTRSRLIIISLAIYRRRVTWVCENSFLNERKLVIRIWYYSQCWIFRRSQVQEVFTMDIKSLYTVIPNNSGLEALNYFLNKRPVFPPTSTLIRLGELVLTLNAFTFSGDFYQQIGGVAMDSKMAQTMHVFLLDTLRGG